MCTNAALGIGGYSKKSVDFVARLHMGIPT